MPARSRRWSAWCGPHIALVTTVAAGAPRAFRLGRRRSPTPRREIFSGLVPGGVAIINRDIDTYDRLRAHAEASPARHVLTFGEHAEADARLVDCTPLRGRLATCRPGSSAGASTSGSARPAGTSPSMRSACCWPPAPPASTSIRPRRRSAATRAGQGRGARSTPAGRRGHRHADRRELQRQPDLDAGRPGAARRDASPARAAAASRCWATCGNSAARPSASTRSSPTMSLPPGSTWSMPRGRSVTRCS